MNFPTKWVEWISCCLSSATTSVLVNGSPSDQIKLKRGVRQGDPISPYLFLIAVEGLKRILDRSGELGFTNGFRFSAEHDPISLLQFADDTILYIPYDREQLRNLIQILCCFELISGLNINYYKSSIMGVNIDEMDLLDAAQMVGCIVEKLPIKYLGLPLASRKLSAGSMPAVVQQQLESYMIQFLWKGDISSRALSKVPWKVICQSFKEGGLGIHNLKVRNQSLLFKWIWKIRISNGPSLWFNVVSSCSCIDG
ncbi:uncharacterized protein LOC126661917 [Mercurialis annua]|uniref:uncharacterized protein LOC126661917 n=1 Tax=Mercurialis annua TaxID=3986 RepID=UPI00215E5ADE|nr:uncharacterized protein LOC126661917 [Mercurialis annua]